VERRDLQSVLEHLHTPESVTTIKPCNARNLIATADGVNKPHRLQHPGMTALHEVQPPKQQRSHQQSTVCEEVGNPLSLYISCSPAPPVERVMAVPN